MNYSHHQGTLGLPVPGVPVWQIWADDGRGTRQQLAVAHSEHAADQIVQALALLEKFQTSPLLNPQPLLAPAANGSCAIGPATAVQVSPAAVADAPPKALRRQAAGPK